MGDNRYEIPRITEHNGMCKLEMDYSKYSIIWPKDKIYERKVYRHSEYCEDLSFNNLILDLIMGMEDLIKERDEIAGRKA